MRLKLNYDDKRYIISDRRCLCDKCDKLLDRTESKSMRMQVILL